MYHVDQDGSIVAPSGLTSKVCDFLRGIQRSIRFEDLREATLPEPSYEKLKPLRGSQTDIVASIIASDCGVIEAPTACHAPGTLIRMYDGTTKRVELVVVGDEVMGPDGSPRVVLSVHSGCQRMYRIVPHRGEPFVVNRAHVLSLKRTNEGKGGKQPRIVNISVDEYLKKSKTFKHLHKLRRVRVDRYGCGPSAVPVDPYFLGVYLGDGGSTNGNIHVTTGEEEIVQALKEEAKRYGLDIRAVDKPGQVGHAYFFRQPKRVRTKWGNELRERLRVMGLYGLRCEFKFVPPCYLVAERAVRLQLLAGLIDTDGYLGSGCFEFSSKSDRLSDDITELARSLGFYARKSEKPVNGEMYYRVSICGDCSAVPTRVKRKQAPVRKQKKDVLVTGFDVESVSEGAYFGFALSGDHLYLTSDFTVHHNSGKSFVIRLLCELYPVNIIICTPFTALLRGMYEELSEILTPNELGLVGDGSWELGRRVTLTTDRSLIKCDLAKCRIFIFDEVHRAASKETSKVIASIRGARMFGFSASPYGRSDKADLETEALFGPRICRVTYQEAQESGSVAPVRVLVYSCERMRSVNFATSSALERHGVWRNPDRNRLIAQAVQEAQDRIGDNAQILISVKTVEHAVDLKRYLPDFELVYAGMSPDKKRRWIRDRLLPDDYKTLDSKSREVLRKRFASGELQRAIATGTWSTGVDFPKLDVLIRGDGMPGKIPSTQIPGRVTRIADGKNAGYVVDFDDSFNTSLNNRALRRLQIYKRKGWEVEWILPK